MRRQLIGKLVAITIVVAVAGAAAGPANAQSVREVVIVQTNDFESAIDPLPAFWLPGSPLMGGAAHIKTMIDEMRAREAARGAPLFLFDSGDMFTGLLSRLTNGEILMEMMITMGYDAMGLGNHEFDYGSANFLKQAHRVPFPVLSCNTFYRGTDILYLQPHAIVEKEGVRLGVIGIIGKDAMSVVVPSLVSDLEFRDPAECLRSSITELEPDVDLIVVLSHQGKTGPMQSDQENDPSVWRDFDEDIELTTRVPGIDVFLGGHAHRGIDPPYVNPETGTIVSQTFGHGTRLTLLRLRVDTIADRVVEHEGGLVTPWSADYPRDPLMERKMNAYREAFAEQIGTVVGSLQERLTRKYRTESDLGNLVADVIRAVGNAEVGLTNAGGLRADLPAGEVTEGHVRDALPFLNSVAVVELTGAQLEKVIEQGLTLERGMIQVSGITVRYDLQRDPGDRAVEIRVGDERLDPARRYRVATNNFVAEGGDLYRTFVGLPWIEHDERSLADLVMGHLGDGSSWPFPPPPRGRLVSVGRVEEVAPVRPELWIASESASPPSVDVAPAPAQRGERAAVLAAVQELFDAMAAKDQAAIDALLVPEGAVFALRMADGETVMQGSVQAGFGEAIAAAPGELLERFWDPTVLIHGPIAVVWTPYDFHVDGRFSHCGVDAFTLVRRDRAWRISGITYTAEREGCAPSWPWRKWVRGGIGRSPATTARM